MNNEPVEFTAEIVKVQNLASGGYRVTLDIPSVFAAPAAILFLYADKPGMLVDTTMVFTAQEWSEDGPA